MQVGDMVRMVTGQPGHMSNPRNVGLVVKVKEATANDWRRVATVFTAAAEVVTWPLDSHYEIKVTNETR